MSFIVCSSYSSYRQSVAQPQGPPAFIGDHWRNCIGAMEPEFLEFGDKGRDVIVLQQALKAIAIYDGPIDGNFSHDTAKAVQTLQRKLGIEVNGIFDSLTWYTLTVWTSSLNGT